MKKSLIIACILGLGLIVFCIINDVQIHQTKNSIRYTEEALYGDVEEVKGIRFRIPNQFGSLAWLTQGSLNEGLKLTAEAMSVYDRRWNITTEPMSVYDMRWNIIQHFDLKFHEEVLPAGENILGICNNDNWMVLTEKNKELFLYRFNSDGESYEKQLLWEVGSKILGIHMEGYDESIVLIIDTEEEKTIQFLQKKNGQWKTCVSVTSKEFECLNQLDSFKYSDEESYSHKEADYSEIAYTYRDGRLAMLWRQNVNAYNLLVLSGARVEYASVLRSNFKQEPDKENVAALRIWFE